MNQLHEIMDFNKEFVTNEGYKKYETDKFPYKKMVVFSCMDTRLTSLLPKAMNLKNGDAKIIKNAGAVITHPFGSIMRSIIVAIYELGANEVYVVGHKGCGMSTVNPDTLLDNMKENGITEDILETLNYSGVDVYNWLHGFDSVELSVAESVDKIKNHPLITDNILIHGLVMDPVTGELELIVDGNK